MRPGDEKLGFNMSPREAYCYSLGVCEGTIKGLGDSNMDLVITEALEQYRRVLAKRLAVSEQPQVPSTPDKAVAGEPPASE